MGRITIFSIEECKFCRRAKAAFSARSIPYTDINIESYPSKRVDMVSLTDRLTVPQIFLNEEHVGGSDEVLAMLAKWDDDIANNRDCIDKSPRERYIRLVESKPDPTDERLAIPEGNDNVIHDIDFSGSRTTEIFQIGEKRYTTLGMTKLLVQRMPRGSHPYLGCLYYNVFKGSTGVTALQKIFHIESREEAVQLGTKLQRKHFIGHFSKDHVFGDNEHNFRLQPFHTPNILNSFYVWCDPPADEQMHMIHRLGKLWSKIESRHLNDDGMVDHATIGNDEFYWKFEEDICELQMISLEHMDDTTKTAFVINLYNLMIKYAMFKMGIPATTASRSSFFDDILINVGGCTFSFNHLEHGILRANTRHPYHLTKPFGYLDTRKRLALVDLDCRVHFALNCGAKSCPPVKNYTAEEIEEELQLAALAFCEHEDNVAIDDDNCHLHLSKILYWYMADFAASKDDLPPKIVHYLQGEKKEKLSKLIHGGSVTVQFLEYDWSSNDTNFNVFEKGDLSDKSILLFARKPPRQKYDIF